MAFTRNKFAARTDRSRYGKRHKPGVMNKTESDYAAILEARRLSGEVVSWEFEPFSLRLAEDCRYTPDFMVVKADGQIEMIDAKGAGPMDDKSVVKIRCAAEKFWMFTFAIEQKQAKKNGGGFVRREF